MVKLRKKVHQKYIKHFENVTFLLFLAFAWETVEHYFELSDNAFLQSIFQGEEFWANRIITDIVAIVVGYYIASKFQHVKFFGTRFLLIYVVIIFSAFLFNEQLHSAYTESLLPVWGHKTKAWFDFWTFIHIFTGTVFGSFVIWWNRRIPEKLQKKPKTT